MTAEEGFAKAAREYLELEKDDYGWDEYDSALDHEEVSDLSRVARFFYMKGRGELEKYKEAMRAGNPLIANLLEREDEQEQKGE